MSNASLKNLDEPALGSPLPHCWYDGQTLSQNNPTDLLDRGCVSRRRNLTQSSQSTQSFKDFCVLCVLCVLCGKITSAPATPATRSERRFSFLPLLYTTISFLILSIFTIFS
ncbi:MAG: hypothetical protein IKX40_04045 [Thermoguttaceae bacterium]|nr:hypothetical protein [Thermoguttaceae bacterium]